MQRTRLNTVKVIVAVLSICTISVLAVKSFSGSAQSGRSTASFLDDSNAEHLGIRLTPQGLHSLLKVLIAKFSSNNPNEAAIKLPDQNITQKVSLDPVKFADVVVSTQTLLGVDLAKGLPFTAAIRFPSISGGIDYSRTKIERLPNHSGSNREHIMATIVVNSIQTATQKLQFCEEKTCNPKKGVVAEISSFSISLEPGSPEIQIQAEFSFGITNGVASIQFESLMSNLDSKYSDRPKFKIGIGKVTLPNVSVDFGSTEYSASSSRVRELVIKYRRNIANEINHALGSFLAKDLAALLNKTIGKAGLNLAVSDTYSYKDNPTSNTPQGSTFDTILKKIEALMTSITVKVTPTAFNLDSHSNLDVAVKTELNLNGDVLTPSVLRNVCNNKAPDLSSITLLGAPENYDFAFAVSEPLLNSILEMANKDQVLETLLGATPDTKNLDMANYGLKLRFDSATQKIIAVAGIILDMSKQPKGTGFDWVFAELGGLLEDINGTGGMAIIPIEFSTKLEITENADKKHILTLKLENPFSTGEPINTMGCRSTLDRMTSIVRNQVVSKFKDALGKLMDYRKPLPLQLSNWLHVEGAQIDPVKIDIEKSGHLVIYGNLAPLSKVGSP